MSTNLEIEFKNILTKTEMSEVIHAFSITDSDFFIQENVYYDTPNLLLKTMLCALRVRIKNKTYELTLKEPKSSGLLETNQMITPDEWSKLNLDQILPAGPVSIRLAELLVQSPLYEIAKIMTKRVSFPYKEQVLFLDESTYYQHTDYELELETQNFEEGKQVFEDLLSRFSIPIRESQSKVKRAYDYKIKMNL